MFLCAVLQGLKSGHAVEMKVTIPTDFMVNYFTILSHKPNSIIASVTKHFKIKYFRSIRLHQHLAIVIHHP